MSEHLKEFLIHGAWKLYTQGLKMPIVRRALKNRQYGNITTSEPVTHHLRYQYGFAKINIE